MQSPQDNTVVQEQALQIVQGKAGGHQVRTHFRCVTCGQDKTPNEYWMTDLRKRLPENFHCKTCKPMPTNEDDLHEAIKRHSMKILSGARCGEEKRSNFNCKTCKPIPPNERERQKKKRASKKIFSCPKCSEEKQSSDFWPRDLVHKNRSNFGCKTCNPTDSTK